MSKMKDRTIFVTVMVATVMLVIAIFSTGCSGEGPSAPTPVDVPNSSTIVPETSTPEAVPHTVPPAPADEAKIITISPSGAVTINKPRHWTACVYDASNLNAQTLLYSYPVSEGVTPFQGPEACGHFHLQLDVQSGAVCPATMDRSNVGFDGFKSGRLIGDFEGPGNEPVGELIITQERGPLGEEIFTTERGCYVEQDLTITRTQNYTCSEPEVESKTQTKRVTVECPNTCKFEVAAFDGEEFSETNYYFRQESVQGSVFVNGPATWRAEIRAASRSSEYRNNDPDYIKRSETVTLDCDGTYTFELFYRSKGHGSDHWWMVLYRDDVLVWKSQDEQG